MLFRSFVSSSPVPPIVTSAPFAAATGGVAFFTSLILYGSHFPSPAGNMRVRIFVLAGVKLSGNPSWASVVKLPGAIICHIISSNVPHRLPQLLARASRSFRGAESELTRICSSLNYTLSVSTIGSKYGETLRAASLWTFRAVRSLSSARW